jgi:hypothetical protein
MKIPAFQHVRWTDKEGYLTPEARLIMEQLFTEMQNNLSEQGFVPPSQTADTIAALTEAAPFTIIGDATNDLPKIKVGGVFKTILTS